MISLTVLFGLAILVDSNCMINVNQRANSNFQSLAGAQILRWLWTVHTAMCWKVEDKAEMGPGHPWTGLVFRQHNKNLYFKKINSGCVSLLKEDPLPTLSRSFAVLKDVKYTDTHGRLSRNYRSHVQFFLCNCLS